MGKSRRHQRELFTGTRGFPHGVRFLRTYFPLHWVSFWRILLRRSSQLILFCFFFRLSPAFVLCPFNNTTLVALSNIKLSLSIITILLLTSILFNVYLKKESYSRYKIQYSSYLVIPASNLIKETILAVLCPQTRYLCNRQRLNRL